MKHLALVIGLALACAGCAGHAPMPKTAAAVPQQVSTPQRLIDDSNGLRAAQRDKADATTIAGWALLLLDDYAVSSPQFVEDNASLLVPAAEAQNIVDAWMRDDGVTSPQIRTLPLERMRGQVSGGYAEIKLARALIREGDVPAARAVLGTYPQVYPKHVLLPQARLLASDVGQQLGEVNMKVGVLLPLVGKNKVYGQSVLSGIECAIGAYAPCVGPAGVQLIIRDEGGDSATASAAVRELAEQGVAAIIGPLRSNVMDAAAAAAQSAQIPMIALAPRSSAPLPAGGFVFRNTMNVDSEVRSLVNYAVQRRGWKRFFVLYPQTAIGQEYFQAFSQAVEAAGASVVGSETYAQHQMEFGTIFRQKQAGQSAPQALFIPDSPLMVGYIVPQLAMAGTDRMQLLGNSRWNSEELLSRAGEYVNGAVFVAAFDPDADVPDVRQFRDAMQQAFNTKPTLLEALGYDSLRMIIAAAPQEKNPNRQQLRDAMAKMTEFPGLTGRISFDASGTAQRHLMLFTVADSSIKLLGDPNAR